MDFIGIDLWDKRVGISISRENIAFPVDIVKRSELISYLKKLLNQNKEVGTIVIGLPYDLYGVDTKQLDKTIKFKDKLQEIFTEIDIVGHDERFSSFEADKGGKTHRDDIAAQCILQSYLDTKK